jgi:hypothetical protein
MLWRLMRTVLSRCRIRGQARLLTVHDRAHILGETVDDLENLSPGRPSPILRESVQPLRDRLDVLLSENLFDKFDCVFLSKVTRQQERTHLVVPV